MSKKTRKYRFGLLMTQQELNALEKLAELEGDLSKADIIRRLIRKEAHKNNTWSLKKNES